MSEEVALAAGDIAFWKRRAEQATALARELQAERDQAEQDAADLRRSMSIMQDDHRRVLALLSQTEADKAVALDREIIYADTCLELRWQIRQVLEFYQTPPPALLKQGSPRYAVLVEAWRLTQAGQETDASLLAELEAARDLIGLFRAHYEAGGEVPGSFPARLAKYDAAVKARAE